MKLLADIFKEIVANMRSSELIIPNTFISSGKYQCTATAANFRLNEVIQIDGVDFLVIKIETDITIYNEQKQSLTVGVEVTANKQAPYYTQETWPQTSNITAEKLKTSIGKWKVYPMIAYIFNESGTRGEQSHYRENKDVEIVIATRSKQGTYSDWSLETNYKPILIPLYEQLLAEIANSFDIITELNSEIEHSFDFLPKLSPDGENNQIVDIIDVIYLRFPNLKIKSDNIISKC